MGLREVSEAGGLTICAVAKPFRGHIRTIQRNAMKSWTRLDPRPEIILLGTEEGTAETARELGLRHVAEVARNSHGTPLLADIFRQAERHGSGEVFAYVNADIMLPREFTAGVAEVRRRFERFLAVGRRTNLEVREELGFEEGWEEKLRERLRKEGQLESHTGIDFFVFPRGTYVEVPPLAIGRVWFDQWLIKYACKRGLPVVDLTKLAPIAHQIHDYNHVAGGRELGTYGGVEAEENLRYYGEKPHAYTLLDVTHEVMEDGGVRAVRWRKPVFKVKAAAWDLFVRRTAKARHALGLRRRTLQAGEKASTQ